MVAQKNSDGFASDFLYEVTPKGFLNDELDRPSRMTRWWVRANHRDDLRVLRICQEARRAFAMTIVKGSFKSTLFVASTNSTNSGFTSARGRGHVHGRPVFVQEQQDPRALQNTRSHDPPRHHHLQLLALTAA